MQRAVNLDPVISVKPAFARVEAKGRSTSLIRPAVGAVAQPAMPTAKSASRTDRTPAVETMRTIPVAKSLGKFLATLRHVLGKCPARGHPIGRASTFKLATTRMDMARSFERQAQGEDHHDESNRVNILFVGAHMRDLWAEEPNRVGQPVLSYWPASAQIDALEGEIALAEEAPVRIGLQASGSGSNREVRSQHCLLRLTRRASSLMTSTSRTARCVPARRVECQGCGLQCASPMPI
jgi:hypothetical protein